LGQSIVQAELSASFFFFFFFFPPFDELLLRLSPDFDLLFDDLEPRFFADERRFLSRSRFRS